MSGANTERGASPEKLQLRAGDCALTLQQLLGLALFQGLTRRAEARLRGKSGHGVAVLRRYRAGDIICREGDAGWTAYYLLQIDDLLWLRESQAALAAQSQELLAIRYAQPDARASASDDDAAALQQAIAARPSQDELQALRAERERLAAGDRCEKELARDHAGLLTLTAEAKRQRADALAHDDEALADRLRRSADSTELRTLAQVCVRRASTVAPKPAGRLEGLVARLFGSRLSSAGERHDEIVVGTLHEGELFGELSCLYHTPRSATVRALRDCYVLEFLSVVLELLLTSEHFQAALDEVFRRRVLAAQLRAIPLFAQVADEAIEMLREGAVLLAKRPGELLYEEGAAADCFYIVRSGTVKLHSASTGRVYDYRSVGSVVGDGEMLRGLPRPVACAAYQHPLADNSDRSRALSTMRVGLIRIDRALFDAVCARHPEFGKQVERAYRESGSEDPSQSMQLVQSTTRFNTLGLHQGRKLMLIDLELCTLCGDCVSGCASLQRDGLPRLSLQGPRFGKYLVPTSCRQCSDPICLAGCPVGAIHRGAAGQIVIEDFCIGCGLCSARCPYSAIELGQSSDKAAQVCDQCATQPDGPECVRSCPHEAAQRVDATTFFARKRVV